MLELRRTMWRKSVLLTFKEKLLILLEMLFVVLIYFHYSVLKLSIKGYRMHLAGLYHEFNPLQISDSYKTVQCWPL